MRKFLPPSPLTYQGDEDGEAPEDDHHGQTKGLLQALRVKKDD